MLLTANGHDMYQPAHFRVDDREILDAFVRAHPLGLLISVEAGFVTADPVPFLLDSTVGRAGRLRAHMARANPHWSLLAKASQALVVFQAAGHYISPSWYPSKAETGKVVPTWNYVNVQVRGAVRIHDDTGWVREQASDITREHEGAHEKAWKLEDAPETFIVSQLRAIVGFEIEIEEMVGKFKLSQNRPAQDARGVVNALSEIDGDGAAVAALMRTHSAVR